MNQEPTQFTEFQVETLIALGATVDYTTRRVSCSGRKGIPYLRVGADKWPLAKNQATKKPVEVACEHEALDLIDNFMFELSMFALVKLLEGQLVHLPKPEDFFYVFTEDVEDTPVEDTSDAAALLAIISQH